MAGSSVLEIVGLLPRVVYNSAEFEEEASYTGLVLVLLLLAVASLLPFSSVLLLVGITAVLVGATLIALSSQLLVGEVCL